MGKPKSNLSVVIVSRWASQFLELCLDSLTKNSYYDNELIVVADFPSWQTLKLLQERRVTHYPCWFSHYDICADFGAWKAHREYVSISNDDVFYGPDWDKAIMDNMRPEFFGSLRRYEGNEGHACSYVCPDLSTWKEGEFLAVIRENLNKAPFNGGVGYPLVHHRGNFFKFYGYTFHTGHAHGHERKLQSRQSRGLPGFQTWQWFGSATYHFGPTSNRDNMPNPVPIRYEQDLGYRDGLRLCLGCGKKERGWGGNENFDDATEVAVRGYWLCARCKQEGRTDCGKFRLWDGWPREYIEGENNENTTGTLNF